MMKKDKENTVTMPMAKIMEATGYSESEAQSALAELEAFGLIKTDPKSKDMFHIDPVGSREFDEHVKSLWKGDPNVIRNRNFRKKCHKVFSNTSFDTFLVFLLSVERADKKGEFCFSNEELDGGFRREECERLFQIAMAFNLIPQGLPPKQ